MHEEAGKLERRVERLVGEQPLRRAPRDLEIHVLAEIARRSAGSAAISPAQRWWQGSFGEWPMAARVAFIVVSCGFARLAMMGLMAVATALRADDSVHSAVASVRLAGNLLGAITATAGAVAHALPQSWIYLGAAASAVLYFALFSLGTMAYRTLYAHQN